MAFDLRTDDDFLRHVFPGSSAAAGRFREEISYLNWYCQRYKGAIPSILLTGESGVGKNYTAHAISAHSQWLTLTDDERHELYYNAQGAIAFSSPMLVDRLLLKEHRPDRGSGPRCVQRLVTLLGPQLADDLAASELFGHRKHAFTGADADHPGIFGDTAADDVLLDEIGDLSLSVQAKLLQFIETHTFRPVGGLAADERVSEHRLFLATNQSLETLVRAGRFREDLFRRLQGYAIHIPPLREGRDTIRDLASSILRSVNQRQRGDERRGPSLNPTHDQYCLLPAGEWPSERPHFSSWVVQLAKEDLDWCEGYDWPGNVRELRQRMELYVYYNGHRRLKDVLPTQPDLMTTPASATSGSSVESLVTEAVDAYLTQALDGSIHAPGQPRSLLGHFEQLVKRAVYQYKTKRRLTKSQLSSLFPDARDAETTLGRWRSRSEDPTGT